MAGIVQWVGQRYPCIDLQRFSLVIFFFPTEMRFSTFQNYSFLYRVAHPDDSLNLLQDMFFSLKMGCLQYSKIKLASK